MLSAKEREVIREMCAIASAQPMNHSGKRGEGDYQNWTLSTFLTADRLLTKMREPDPAFELLRVLKAAVAFLEMFYDPTEDKRADPIMQSLGRNLTAAKRVIAKHEIPNDRKGTLQPK